MIYGPFTVFTHDDAGDVTDVAAGGVHYTTDSATLAAWADLLSPFVVTPSHPLQTVMAGDDPAEPDWTVSLRFADQATADATVAAMAPADT